ncbi:MAG: hypothetical protein SFT93_01915 [Rickettsiaceae bacterium]|nr:hypothetical protein [Rickettsiaceae bacterium]
MKLPCIFSIAFLAPFEGFKLNSMLQISNPRQIHTLLKYLATPSRESDDLSNKTNTNLATLVNSRPTSFSQSNNNDSVSYLKIIDELIYHNYLSNLHNEYLIFANITDTYLENIKLFNTLEIDLRKLANIVLPDLKYIISSARLSPGRAYDVDELVAKLPQVRDTSNTTAVYEQLAHLADEFKSYAADYSATAEYLVEKGLSDGLITDLSHAAYLSFLSSYFYKKTAIFFGLDGKKTAYKEYFDKSDICKYLMCSMVFYIEDYDAKYNTSFATPFYSKEPLKKQLMSYRPENNYDTLSVYELNDYIFENPRSDYQNILQ